MPIAPTQQQLAAALGVHASVVTRDKGRGMPVDSIEAARAWRLQHVRPRGSDNAARNSAALLAELDSLWPLARAALEAGKFEVIRPALQSALRAVPAEARPHVHVDLEVMTELCSGFIGLMREAAPDLAPARGRLSDAEADAMARVWYCIAAGEPFPAAWLACDGQRNESGPAGPAQPREWE